MRIGDRVINLAFLIECEPADSSGRRRIWLSGGRSVDLDARESEELWTALEQVAPARSAPYVLHAVPADPATGQPLEGA